MTRRVRSRRRERIDRNPFAETVGQHIDEPKLGDALKQRFSGWRAYIFTGDRELPRLIRLSASKRTPLFNGAIECRLYEFKMVAGSMRPVKPASAEGPTR